MPLLALDESALEESISGTQSWIQDPSGTLRHKTGTALSEKDGVTVEGSSYMLKPTDIELEEGGIGSGVSGQVKKGMIKATGQSVAIKAIKIDDNGKKGMLLAELKNLVAAERCDYLITWYGGFVTRNIVSLVLELMDLGSLRTLAQRAAHKGCAQVPPCHLALISFCSVSGLHFLHEMKIVHRDIKPENILHNSQGQVKITDFGISRSLDATIAMAGTQIGTQFYMAPEMVQGSEYNFAVDLWAYGLVCFELATGQFPLAGTTIPELFFALMESPEPRLSPDYPEDLQDFVAQCLMREWERRGDAASLLGKPFLSSVESMDDFVAYLNHLIS